MKKAIFTFSLLVFLNFISMAQDTIILEEKPVPLNYSEVMKSL